MSLGANGAFWAYSDQGQRWSGVPQAVLDQYQKYTRPDLFVSKRVRTVDFGYGDSFVGIGVDNVWFWSLHDDYPELRRLAAQRNLSTLVSGFLVHH